MKALSLLQPWATMLVQRFKMFETRGWMPTRDTLSRGDWLAIHSARAWSIDQQLLCDAPYFREAFARLGDESLHLGTVIGFVQYGPAFIVGEDIETNDVSEQEIAFGDWSLNRRVWRFDDAYACRVPILTRGKQGIFNVDIDFEELLRNGHLIHVEDPAPLIVE